MGTTIQGAQTGQIADFTALARLAAAQVQAQGGASVPGSQESVKALLESVASLGAAMLPDLEEPATGTSGTASFVGGLSMGGLSLETLLDAVGMEQRRTETKAGISSLEARAQERAEANEEKLKAVQEQLEKSKSQGFLDGLLKAFKIIGMVLGAIGSVAMIAAGAAGLVAGGSGAALIAVGVASLYMTIDSAVQMGTDGKVGIGLGSAVGAVVKACGGSESAAEWTRFAVDFAVSIALAVVGGLAAAGKIGGSAAKAAADAASTAVETGAKTASTVADATAKASTAADKIQKAAAMTARIATIAGGANTIAQSGTTIASAVNEKDISFLQAQQKRLQAILERIAMANDLDIEHIKEMMQRSEQTLQTVSDIVQEGAQTNTALLSGSPAMA